DRRSVLVGLTGAGADLLARLSRARRASAESLFARLDASQRDQLLELLTTLNERDTPPAGQGAPS
ncbi:MAG: MarR family transcriptional regulator, partial [Thermoleophilia bacterium]